jgi:hypothetical protein
MLTDSCAVVAWNGANLGTTFASPSFLWSAAGPQVLDLRVFRNADSAWVGSGLVWIKQSRTKPLRARFYVAEYKPTLTIVNVTWAIGSTAGGNDYQVRLDVFILSYI